MNGTPTNPRIAVLQAIADPLERAAECQTTIIRGRETLAEAERLRTEAIRLSRENTSLTVDAIAAKVGVRRNVVVEALRRRS
jgi:GTP-sensing pleiotropic transcriptional regulator CodY